MDNCWKGNFMEIKRNTSIDALRAWAILLIVASHSGFLAQGGLGNSIFFAISGFFSTYPFKIDDKDVFSSFSKIIRYYIERILRIMPVYVLVLVSVFCLMDGFFSKKSLLENIFFVNNYGHLWFLQQEMFMYLFIPFIVLFMSGIKKIVRFKYTDIICAVLLLILAYLSKKYLTTDFLWLLGNNAKQKVRFFQLLIGMAAGYLYKSYLVSGRNWGTSRLFCFCAGSYNIAYLLLCVLSSNVILKKLHIVSEDYYIGWELPGLCSVFAAISIIMLLIANQSIVTRIIGNAVLGFIGKISFSIYLVHYFIIVYFGLQNTMENLIMVYISSIGIAILLYYLIEKPSIVFAKTKSIRSVITYYKELL